jgi:hypothetical protein
VKVLSDSLWAAFVPLGFDLFGEAGGVGAAVVEPLGEVGQVGGEQVRSSGRLGQQVLGRLGAGELAGGLAVQAQFPGDRGDRPSLGDQVLYLGVPFPMPQDQSAFPGGRLARWLGRRGSLVELVVAGFALIRVRFGRVGFAQVGAAGDDGLLDRVTQVLEEGTGRPPARCPR